MIILPQQMPPPNFAASSIPPLPLKPAEACPKSAPASAPPVPSTAPPTPSRLFYNRQHASHLLYAVNLVYLLYLRPSEATITPHLLSYIQFPEGDF
jgi:hypothetical protein